MLLILFQLLFNNEKETVKRERGRAVKRGTVRWRRYLTIFHKFYLSFLIHGIIGFNRRIKK